MDALAADRLLGESSPEMFAFGSFSKGKEETCENEWRAGNVTPILYHEPDCHAHLHNTLCEWAETYRDRVGGKEYIAAQYAMARPSASRNNAEGALAAHKHVTESGATDALTVEFRDKAFAVIHRAGRALARLECGTLLEQPLALLDPRPVPGPQRLGFKFLQGRQRHTCRRQHRAQRDDRRELQSVHLAHHLSLPILSATRSSRTSHRVP